MFHVDILIMYIVPECCYVNLVVFEVLKVQSFNIKGCKCVMVLKREELYAPEFLFSYIPCDCSFAAVR